MNIFSSYNIRNRRNLLEMNSQASVRYPTSTYCTHAQTKPDMMKHTIEENLLKNLHHLPDPLKKNLAHSVITGERKNMMETKNKTHVAVTPQTTQRTDNYPALSGITSLFSGAVKVMGTIFQKRASSPASQYFDCFDTEYTDSQMAPQMLWQASNFEVQNKNDSHKTLGSTNDSHTNLEVEMNVECKTAAAQCEEKLNEVRRLLSNKPVQNVQKPRSPRRSKKVFVESGSVEENFEDAFSESVISLANDTFVECCSPFNVHDEVLIQSDAPSAKTDIHESMDIIENIPEIQEAEIVEVKQNQDMETISNEDLSTTKTNNEVISSCEDKLNKLKELLQSTHCKKSKTTDPEPLTMENKIDTVFDNEINTDLDNSHDSDNFNEVTGRFSSSVDSDDSFQIVFSDSPQKSRRRIPSECESEDSFIVFEESPDSCYTSNEVFGEEILEDDSSDSESECESDSDVDDDSGCGDQCKLAPSMSKTFGNLTDNSLYDYDVVDSAAVCSPCVMTQLSEGTSSELDEVRKEKKSMPERRVHFSTEPPKVHVMRVWAFAARKARAGHWGLYALDRERFKRRIADVEMAISWVLKPQHRTRVVFQRFTPWWNAQRRIELMEKKEAEDMEKRRLEEDGKSNSSDETLNYCDNSVPEFEDSKNDPHLDKDETKIIDSGTEIMTSIDDKETEVM